MGDGGAVPFGMSEVPSHQLEQSCMQMSVDDGSDMRESRHSRLCGFGGADRTLEILAIGSSSTEGIGASSPSNAYPARTSRTS